MSDGQVVPPSALSSGPKPRRRSQDTWSNSMKEQPARIDGRVHVLVDGRARRGRAGGRVAPVDGEAADDDAGARLEEEGRGEVGGPARPQLERAAGPHQGQAGAAREVQAGVTAELVAGARREDQRAAVRLRRDPGVERRARVRRAGRVDRGRHREARGRRRGRQARARARRWRRCRARRGVGVGVGTGAKVVISSAPTTIAMMASTRCPRPPGTSRCADLMAARSSMSIPHWALTTSPGLLSWRPARPGLSERGVVAADRPGAGGAVVAEERRAVGDRLAVAGHREVLDVGEVDDGAPGAGVDARGWCCW